MKSITSRQNYKGIEGNVHVLEITLHFTLICLSIGTSKTINFPFGTNGFRCPNNIVFFGYKACISSFQPAHVDITCKQQ